MEDETVLMEGAGILPIVRDEDVLYTVDVAKQQFRLVDKAYVVIPFDSCIGRQVRHALDMNGYRLEV